MKHLVDIVDIVKTLKAKNVQADVIDEKFVTRGVDVKVSSDIDMLAHLDVLKQDCVDAIVPGIIADAAGRKVYLFMIEQYMRMPEEGVSEKVFSFIMRLKYE